MPIALLLPAGLLAGVALVIVLPARSLRGAPSARLGLAIAAGAGGLLGPLLSVLPTAIGGLAGAASAWSASLHEGLAGAVGPFILPAVQLLGVGAILVAYGRGSASIKGRPARISPRPEVALLVVVAAALLSAAHGWPPAARLESHTVLAAARVLAVAVASTLAAFAVAPLVAEWSRPTALAGVAGLAAAAPLGILALAPVALAWPLSIIAAILAVYVIGQLLHLAQTHAGGGARTTLIVAAAAVVSWTDGPLWQIALNLMG